MSLLGEEPVTIMRFPDVSLTYDNTGRFQIPLAALIPNVAMSVQPLKQDEWQYLGLGGRALDYRKVYSETMIRTGLQESALGGQPHLPDRLIIGDITDVFGFYNVVQVNSYAFICPHWRAVVRRVPELSGGV